MLGRRAQGPYRTKFRQPAFPHRSIGPNPQGGSPPGGCEISRWSARRVSQTAAKVKAAVRAYPGGPSSALLYIKSPGFDRAPAPPGAAPGGRHRVGQCGALAAGFSRLDMAAATETGAQQLEAGVGRLNTISPGMGLRRRERGALGSTAPAASRCLPAPRPRPRPDRPAPAGTGASRCCATAAPAAPRSGRAPHQRFAACPSCGPAPQ